MRPKARQLTTYRIADFFCDESDVARIAQRTGWLSGEGLAVFLQGELQRLKLTDVSIVYSRTLLDVELYGRAVIDGEGSVDACLEAVKTRLAQVRGEMDSWLGSD